jgi:hypothetical protein
MSGAIFEVDDAVRGRRLRAVKRRYNRVGCVLKCTQLLSTLAPPDRDL